MNPAGFIGSDTSVDIGSLTSRPQRLVRHPRPGLSEKLLNASNSIEINSKVLHSARHLLFAFNLNEMCHRWLPLFCGTKK